MFSILVGRMRLAYPVCSIHSCISLPSAMKGYINFSQAWLLLVQCLHSHCMYNSLKLFLKNLPNDWIKSLSSQMYTFVSKWFSSVYMREKGKFCKERNWKSKKIGHSPWWQPTRTCSSVSLTCAPMYSPKAIWISFTIVMIRKALFT